MNITVKQMIEKLSKYQDDMSISEVWINWVCEHLDEEVAKIEDLKKEFANYLSLSRDEFSQKTTYPTPDGGGYSYHPTGGIDNDENRISYLQYLRDKKHLI